MAEGALSDLKVLDFTHRVAGPYCTKLMSGLGATVVKVERPDTGDSIRQVGPFYKDQPGVERSCPFLYLNTDKQSITLNLKSAEGIEIAKKLVQWADVVVESFRPGVMERRGLGYEALEKLNPRLIMVSISNFGQTGPYRDYAMTDLTAQAIGGLMNELGEPENTPLKLGGYQALYSAGVAGFTAAMTALVTRDLRGIGQFADVSIFEMVAFTEWKGFSYYEYNKREKRRQGRNNQWKLLRSRDGHVAVVGEFPQRFSGGTLDDERFATEEGRLKYSVEWGEALESWLVNYDSKDLYARAQAAGLPWGYVASFEDLIESPQYRAREFFRRLDRAETGSATYSGQPFRVGDLPSGPWEPAPLLGQHNAAVYGGLLGYSDADIERLRGEGVI